MYSVQVSWKELKSGEPKPIYLPHRGLDPTISTSQQRREVAENHSGISVSTGPPVNIIAYHCLQVAKSQSYTRGFNLASKQSALKTCISFGTHPKLNPLHRWLHIFSFNLHLWYPSICMKISSIELSTNLRTPLRLSGSCSKLPTLQSWSRLRHTDPT